MNTLKNISLKWKLALGFAVPLVLFVIVAFIVNNNLNRLVESQKWVTHTHKAVQLGDQITVAILDMESGILGYLVTGNDDFLYHFELGEESFKELMAKTQKHVSDNEAQLDRLALISSLEESWQRELVDPAILIRKDMDRGKATSEDLESFLDEMIDEEFIPAIRDYLDQFIGEEYALVAVRNEAQVSQKDATRAAATLGAALAILIGIVGAVLITRYLLKVLGGEPTYAIQVANRVANGKLDEPIDVKAGDDSSLISAMNIMQENLIERIKSDEEKLVVSTRLKQALDSVTANVMVADADRNIIYANDAVVSTLRNAQSDLRKELPNFDVDTMMGGSIDQFHKNPAHQKGMLEGLTATHKAKIVVGGRHMGLIVTPVFSDEGVRLGTVVEWSDQTTEVGIQDEMDNIIQAANEGNLSRRVSMEGKEGFFASMSHGLNTLLDKTSDFVADVGSVFEAMSEGDLTKTIETPYKGEFDQIKSNANNSMAKVSEVLIKIQAASSSVRSAANEVAQGSDDLSRRTESQASSLEETASSMEEMTATVKQTSDNATQANTLASEAKNQAQSGGDVVQNAVTAMAEILESSNKINDIIGVIDEIAFQTNLLALNAAVEAARAGEQGRGFAVVAGEVRTLSQRSAAAAKEIKDLIRDSVGKVESGSKLVNQSGETLAEIVAAVEKVATMIEDVNTASMEQNSGIGQINQAINQMDEMTQQNAALVEETSAASRSMSEEATSMNNMISFFKLGGSSPRAASMSPVQAPNMAVASQSVAAPIHSASGGAASFSSDDEWEDF